uniref:Uncharacterized protein n=2 Tax=Triticinae TaxID=1648030 RepID=A0A452ZUX1_AEGTS
EALASSIPLITYLWRLESTRTRQRVGGESETAAKETRRGLRRCSRRPSKPSPAEMDVNHMMRSQRINPDSLADGGVSGASRNPAAPAPAPKPSKDERAPDVVVDTSRLAPYFPRTSLENRPASSSAALLSHYRYNVAMDTSHSQGPDLGGGGGGGIALSDCPLPLQWWGHGKRSRSRRETPVPEPELTRAEVRRQKSLNYRSRRAAKAKARAAMAPPGARGPNLSASPSPPPRAGTLWLHGYPGINSDSLPLADGGGGSMILRPVSPTPDPTQSKLERTPLVVADTSCLTPYFGRTTLENHMTRGRPASSSAALVSHHIYNIGMHTYQGPNVGGGLSSDIVRTSLEQHKLWGHAPYPPQPAYSPIAPVSHHLLNNAMHTSQGSNVTGGGGNTIASPNAHVPLQWGQRKRPRSRREAPARTPAPKPELTPAKAHVKPMVSSGACEPNLITYLSLPPPALTLSLRSSAAELHNTVGEQQPTLKEEKVMPPPSALGPIFSTVSPHAATLSHHRCSLLVVVLVTATMMQIMSGPSLIGCGYDKRGRLSLLEGVVAEEVDLVLGVFSQPVMFRPEMHLFSTPLDN